MAKGKHAAALFEVIHRDVRYAPARQRQSPVRWLKDRLGQRRAEKASAGQSQGRVAAMEVDPTQRATPIVPQRQQTRAVPSQGLGMTQVEPADHPVGVMSGSAFEASPVSQVVATAAPIRSPMAASPSARASLASVFSPAVQIDRTRQFIKVHFSYTSAAIVGFAVLVALVLAFVVGRSGSSTAEVPENGLTSQAIRAGAITPGVLDVNATNNQGGLAGQMISESPPAAATNNAAAASGRAVAPPAAAVVDNGQRIVGMNYVIVQSYPEEKEAQEAVQLLIQNGVGATVVKGTAYAPRWYSVVGVTPFDRLSGNQQYQAYVAQINQLSDKFAGNSRFKRFEPRPYKWQNQ